MTRRASDEAADWYSRLHAPDGARHCAAFEAWRASDPNHAHEYDRIAELAVLAGRTSHRPSARARGLTRHRARLTTAAALAAVSVALVVAVVVTPGWYGTGAAPTIIAQATAAPAMFRLKDGSTVVLDRGGRARVMLDRSRRHVILERGRARFDVTRDRTRPFIVDAARQRVVARATRFEVLLTQDGARVAVSEGAVDVGLAEGESAFAERHTLAAGDVAQTTGGAMDVTRAARRTPNARDNRRDFEGATLAEVAAAANQLGGPPLRIDDTALAAERVTGMFDVRDRPALARKLAAAFDLRIVADGDTIVLQRK